MFNKYPFLEAYQDYIIAIYDKETPIEMIVDKSIDITTMRHLQTTLKAQNLDVNIKVDHKRHDVDVLAVMSGKGGVGKSYVTSLLAKAYSEDKKVLLLDLDIYGYSIPEIFDCFEEIKMIDDQLMPIKYDDHLDIISAQYFIKDLQNEAIIWRGPKLNQLMELMINHIDYRQYDLVIIDTPPTTGDIVLNINQYYSNVSCYLVTTPKILDQKVSLRSYQLANQLGFNCLGYIINQSYYNYNDEKLYIYGQDYLNQVKPLIKCELEINNDDRNLLLIKNMIEKSCK